HGYRRYATELLHALVTLKEEYQWLLHGWSASLDVKWIESLRKPGVELSLMRVPGHFKRLYWNTLRIPQIESLIGSFDIFHSTDPLLPPTRKKSIITIHDLVYLKFPHLVERRVVRWGRQVRDNVARADAIVVVSSHTKRDVLEFFSVPESKLHVVYPIISPRFTSVPASGDDEILARYSLQRPYILFVATIEPRKNLLCLLQAYDRTSVAFRKEVKLVVVGRKGWKSEETVRAILRREEGGCVMWLRNVSDAELPALYRHAMMFVYPSLYEGFGFPVAEALACGTPVITSTAASLPEVAGRAAVFVDPEKTEALTAAMESLAHDESAKRRLQQLGPERARMFDPHHAVTMMLSLYRTLA
ncbi:MAG TPA: glycosyltransferase family 1 protein, partial [Bacteroidota bacterium]|nr:glycosyltransferase family 1 protein [Bacteroidota bacterium]